MIASLDYKNLTGGQIFVTLVQKLRRYRKVVKKRGQILKVFQMACKGIY